MARVGITEAAARLNFSVDSVRRRVRAGHIVAQGDNRGVWWVEVPDDVVPMQPVLARQPSAMVAPPYALPMQPSGEPVEHGRADELVDVLRVQVADLMRQRDAADAKMTATEAERAKLFDLVLGREEQGAALIVRTEAAERRAAEMEALVAGELSKLRSEVTALSGEQERIPTPDLLPGSQSGRATRPRRRGLLARLFG